VTLRPLEVHDFVPWRDVRLANEDWLLPWEPMRPAGIADPARDRSAFESRCAARERERSSDYAYPFGLFVDQRFAGEVNINNVTRGALQGATIGYWIDRAQAGNGYVAEAVVLVLQFASNSCSCTGSRSASCPATPTAAGLSTSSSCAVRVWPNASSRSQARGRTTCDSRSPRKSGSPAPTS
jgi:hypothetical protein